jgi:hypothetical protein
MTKARNLADLLNADGQIDNADIADNTIANAKLEQTPNFRNIIINGDMSIAQRGTSFTGLTNGDNSEYLVDRFNFSESGSETFVFTVSQSTDVPTGQGFANSLKYLVTTADTSLDSLGGVALNYRFEGQMLQYLKKGTANAESLTLSFWFKSSLTGTYIAELFDKDNDRTISKSYTVNTADTWEKKTITFAGDTTGAFDNDNARSMDLTFWFSAGSGYQSGTLQTSWGPNTAANRGVGQVDWSATASNELYITGVQLEAGTTASDFEFLPYDVNLQRCQRYCYAYANYGAGPTSGNYMLSARYATSGSHTTIVYPTQMRIQPSITYGTGGGGVVDTDYSTPSNLQLYDAADAGWYIYDVLAEAEL